jgi:hypothetical protein
MVSYLAYFPKENFSDLFPVCLCPHLHGCLATETIYDERRDRPFNLGRLTELRSWPAPPPSQAETEYCLFWKST